LTRSKSKGNKSWKNNFNKGNIVGRENNRLPRLTAAVGRFRCEPEFTFKESNGIQYVGKPFVEPNKSEPAITFRKTTSDVRRDHSLDSLIEFSQFTTPTDMSVTEAFSSTPSAMGVQKLPLISSIPP
jgi:hypothetical protein